ncbi:hypothetical protein PSU4_47940 [Pseudonocardia sulfidoxydans NBRC 16205]|uniref:STAS domain-containing protein n=2 Tax=Pseudonocardia sulfidoxydans TaxID=54011 RepID=A0A511DLZ8_9PSEU|nr:STAS domain-containing protein [Pseudonocardia sulfidoxydans]GEL25840.1 hypothetical protein PSU4_47940 [Pseudonocardia sulfidoxydans NBRC 16205]
MTGQPDLPSSTWSCTDGTARVVSSEPGTVRVQLAGEIDLTNSDDLGRWLAEWHVATLQIDLRQVRFLAVCGARRLAVLRTELDAGSRRLQVIPPDDVVIRRVLDALGPFELVESEAGAPG